MQLKVSRLCLEHVKLEVLLDLIFHEISHSFEWLDLTLAGHRAISKTTVEATLETIAS